MLWWTGCDRELPTGGGGGSDLDTAGMMDADGDGWPAGDDCDDEEPLDHPDAAEDCSDGRDNDCDGDEDDADADCEDRA